MLGRGMWMAATKIKHKLTVLKKSNLVEELGNDAHSYEETAWQVPYS